MSDRLARMQRGDKEALRELLEERGALLMQLRMKVDVATSPVTLAELALAIWKASVLWRPNADEQTFVLNALLRSFAHEPREPTKFEEIDPLAFATQVGRVLSGLGDEDDQVQLEEMVEGSPDLGARVRELSKAVDESRQAKGPLPGLDRLWQELAPQLR